MINTATRNIDGIILLDKPLGLSSNQALQRVKHLYRAKKAGHTGSLDVMASGLLPICLGEATKFSSYLLEADKTYETEGLLGTTTTTGDSEGDILHTQPANHIQKTDLEKILPQFIGTVAQIPPMYSALKHQGKPLYKLARRGETVDRPARHITIYHLTLLQFGEQFGETRFTLRVDCSKGTYIRTLVEDIGKTLGCGATVTRLRRLRVGQYAETAMLTLPTLETIAQQDITALDNYCLGFETALTHLPLITLPSSEAFAVRQGKSITYPATPAAAIRLMTESGIFLGIGEIDAAGCLRPKRLLREELTM